jgi:hypothetical protein
MSASNCYYWWLSRPELLAEIDGVAYWGVVKMDFQADWSIENFCQLMDSCQYGVKQPTRPTRFTFPLPGVEEKAALEIQCYVQRPTVVEVRVELRIPRTAVGNDVKTVTSIGLVDRNSVEVIWGESSDNRFTASMPHAKLLAEAADLLPGGEITFLVKVSVATCAGIGIEGRPPAKNQKGEESLSEAMLDNFAEIGGTVLLVFEDGEQRCHSFPLAAREDRSPLFVTCN